MLRRWDAKNNPQDYGIARRFFGIRDFPYLTLRMRDFKAKSGRVLGLKVCLGGGMPKIILQITGLHEILGRDYGIEKPYWGPHRPGERSPE